MLFIFFWKEMSWILFFHLLFSCHKIIFRETSYILLHHGIRNTFTVLGTNTNNFWWSPARKACSCATGRPCQKVTEGLKKQCTVKEVSKYVVPVRCKWFFEFVTVLLGMYTCIRYNRYLGRWFLKMAASLSCFIAKT